MEFVNHVIAILLREKTYFEQDEMTEDQISFSSCNNSEQESKPGNKDVSEAHRLVSIVQNEIPGITGSLDCVEEWVFITFRNDSPDTEIQK